MLCPKLAVVIPWCEARGEDAQHLEKWTRGQTLPREQYQVVLGYPADCPGEVSRFEGLLSPQDIAVPGVYPHSLNLWHEAILAAEAEWIFVTELHCLPQKDTLERVLESAEENGLDAFSISTGHINKSDVAWMEEQIYHSLTPELSAECQWNLLRLRGFAVRREWVQRLGGFLTRYDLFAELVFSLEMDRLGAKVGLDPQAKVYHCNQSEMTGHREDLARFVRGEMLYRFENPESMWISYLSVPDGMADLWRLRAKTARRLLRGWGWLDARSGDDARLHGFLRAQFPRVLTAALCGPAIRLAGEALKWCWWELCYALSRGRTRRRFSFYQRETRAYVELWRCLGALRGSRSVVEPGSALVGDFALSWGDAVSLCQDGAGAIRWLGFYGLEEHGGISFRWGMGLCGWELALGPGDWTVEVDTGGIRQAGELSHVAALYNGKGAEATWLDATRLCISLSVPPGAKVEWSELVVLTPPLEGVAEEDGRELGLPVAGFRCCRGDG